MRKLRKSSTAYDNSFMFHYRLWFCDLGASVTAWTDQARRTDIEGLCEP